MAADITIKEATQLLKILQSQGRAIPVGSDFFFSTEQLRTLAREVADWLSEKGVATVAEIRDQLGMTRKHVVPLVESLDRHGITLRNGDVRTVAADVAQRIEELN
jgi:selenocysteine-specific elongation factor